MTVVAIRSRAEDRLRMTRRQVSNLSEKDTIELVHELQVHQIELEMQNEELRRLQEELAVSRQKYRDIYDFAPIGFITLNKDGIIQEANFYASQFLGLPRGELQKKRLHSLIATASQDECFIHFRRVFETGGRHSTELKLADRLIHVNSQAHMPEDGLCCTTMTDVTHLMKGKPVAR